jgi:O-acetyl-ADP-ribose deacetylase (regulator of RNase III)
MLTQTTVGSTLLELVQGNIAQQEDVDAIVNAANTGLAGGGGVDGAIHRAGGPSIMEECRQIGRCPTGEARITGAGKLAAKFVIHAVGPFYSNREKDSVLLASAYRNSLRVAVENAIHSVALPSLSTGAYRYPVRDASQIALKTVIEFLNEQLHELQLVRFVLFDAKTFEAYGTTLKKLRSE